VNFQEQLGLLPDYLTAHLQLTLVALGLGIGLSLPLGLLAARLRWLEQVVLSSASVIQTIPSLALLAVIVPVLAALHFPSIGYLPAVIGLTLYSLLPILRNTVTGLHGIDPAYVEAALGVGMTPAQQLFRVELPLALPVIVAGIRTATVWTVGIATLSTPIGAPSLGNYIFTGLQTRNYASVIVGSVSAAGLALLLDGLVRMLEAGLQREKRTLISMALVLFAILIGVTAWASIRSFTKSDAALITVGAKTFTEQYILSEILAQKIQSDTGLHTKVLSSLGSTVAFDALRSGQIDVYVDYSGTIWATIMQRSSVPQDRSALLNEVQTFLQKEHGIVIPGALGFENTYALAMRCEQANALGIRQIGDLRNHAPQMTIGGDYEFFGRPEWKAVEATYGLAFAKTRSMDPTLMYQAAANKTVDVISAFSTDGRIAAFDLCILEDNRGAIPPYDAVILASPRVARDHPEVIRSLQGLAGTINADRMRRLNLLVDQEKQSPAQVAGTVLRELPTPKQ